MAGKLRVVCRDQYGPLPDGLAIFEEIGRAHV